jgi:hypothetical protein
MPDFNCTWITAIHVVEGAYNLCHTFSLFNFVAFAICNPNNYNLINVKIVHAPVWIYFLNCIIFYTLLIKTISGLYKLWISYLLHFPKILQKHAYILSNYCTKLLSNSYNALMKVWHNLYLLCTYIVQNSSNKMP